MRHAEKGIFWLSSYPKSGNTWFRIVLANLLNQSAEPIDLNQINTGTIASARAWIDGALGFDSALFNHDEIDQFRPVIYKQHGEEAKKNEYHKIHDAYTYLNNGMPMIPAEGCLGALYIIRNPLDVAISFANHARSSIDQTIENMDNRHYAFCRGAHRLHDQVRQQLLSWSLHVQSWTSITAFNVLVIRYEDMKQDPVNTFTNAIEFLQIQATAKDVEMALDHASIEKLQGFEAQFGFSEKPPNVSRFFRKGIVGDWQQTLNNKQIERIISCHGDVMRQFGYLDKNGNPI